MGGLIKADFKKLFKGKTLLVCSIIAVCFGALMIYIMNMSINMIESQLGMMSSIMGGEDAILELSGIPQRNVWSMVNYLFTDSDVGILTAICICVFITSEYSMGTFKNSVSRGFSRTQIYISKFIVSVVSSLIIVSLFVIGGIIVAFISMPTNTDVSLWQMILMIFTYLILAVASASMYLMFAMLFRKTGVSVATSICIVVFVSSIFQVLGVFVENFSNYSRFWILNTFTIVEKSCLDGEIYIPLLIGLGYIVVTGAIGLMVFRKRDIK
ncbi:MAG: ABC transporter permease subunit [Clostridia bacterium]|nr:ABC transporter permease subunit [Clostridia bacterium]